MVFGGVPGWYWVPPAGSGGPQEILGASWRFWVPPGRFGVPAVGLTFSRVSMRCFSRRFSVRRRWGRNRGKNRGRISPGGVLMSPGLTRPQATAARPQLTLISICSSISLFLMAAYSFSSLRGTRGRAGTRGRGQAPARASRGGVPGGRSPSSPLHLLGVVLDLEGPEDELVGAAVELVRDHLLEVLRAQPGLKPRPQNAALVSSSAPKHGPKSSPARRAVPKHSPQPPPVKTPTKSAPKRVPSDRNLLQNAAHQVNDP